MALLLEKTTPSGVTATYWKINNIDIHSNKRYVNENDMNMYHANFRLVGYYNETTRQENKQTLEDKQYNISQNITIGPEVDLRPTLYTYLKTLPEWETAQDV